MRSTQKQQSKQISTLNAWPQINVEKEESSQLGKFEWHEVLRMLPKAAQEMSTICRFRALIDKRFTQLHEITKITGLKLHQSLAINKQCL